MKTHSAILFKNKLNYNLRNRVAKQPNRQLAS